MISRENVYQSALIFTGTAAAVLFGFFLMREVYPEYKIYQNRYLELETIRSEMLGQPVPYFKGGIKQIVIPEKDNGPETIDRCTSCHVALKLEHFSPTKIAKDINGNVVLDVEGKPVQEPNENYIWGLIGEDNAYLKTVKVGEHTYDVTKVLAMHPLIGKETRPFELHPMEEYGCTSCHNGNGRGLTTEKAHGPVYDGTYEISEIANKPQFLEVDPNNDPKFSTVLNDKPGHQLLFQTTPLFVGNLIQAKCVQCHQPSSKQVDQALETVENLSAKNAAQVRLLEESLLNQQAAVITLLEINKQLKDQDKQALLKQAQARQSDYSLSEKERQAAKGQYSYLLKYQDKDLGKQIQYDLVNILGSRQAVEALEKQLDQKPIEAAVKDLSQKGNFSGALFEKAAKLREEQEASLRLKSLRGSVIPSHLAVSQVDRLTQDYQRGEELYLSQACYACHRIAGVARGGVGPELTYAGHLYPWYIKESIVWPQADLRTSVMPNMRLDHEEVEDLVTYLLAQRHDRQIQSDVERKKEINAWEKGKQVSFEKPIPSSEIHDLRSSMTVFAAEGCAACHRLEGYQSNVGFAVEKEGADKKTLFKEKNWFRNLFPKDVIGSHIVSILDTKGLEIDKRIVDDVRQDAILEQIERDHPQLLESFYSNFKYALRAKNHLGDDKKIAAWQKRVRRVLMMYIQEYGLGRLVGPPVGYSGVYRSDQWLMEHFWNPSAHSAKSIMPTFPFDNTKFLALTYMLDVLGKRNREELREMWEVRGFNPAEAYEMLCSNCHGPYLQGNGPVAQWIYPIPKNLRNAIFLRSQTKDMVRQSIVHGIKGGPMAPWGEVGVGKEGQEPVLTGKQIDKIVDWIFSDLPGEYYIQEEEIQKWKYTPEDVLKELQKEGDSERFKKETSLSCLPTGEGMFVSVDPWVPVEGKKEVEDPWEPEEGYPKQLDVNSVFDVDEKASVDGKRPSYYIKEKYYTDKNLMQGEDYFITNCSICHGREGDGAGLRAGTMQEAKPRMLTNLDWLETRDDLRLIQSIKYGVAGTSMTPWGDATTSLQRMQLVMYIRSLSWQQQQADRLNTALYEAFDTSKWAVEDIRGINHGEIKNLQRQAEQLRAKREQVLASVSEGEKVSGSETNLYDKELQSLATLHALNAKDQLLSQLVDLEESLKNEFSRVGNTILTLKGEGARSLFSDWLKMVQLQGHYMSKDGKGLQFRQLDQEAIASLKSQMLQGIEQKLATLQRQKITLEGKIASLERNQELDRVSELEGSYTRLKNVITAAVNEAARVRKKELEIYKDYQNGTK